MEFNHQELLKIAKSFKEDHPEFNIADGVITLIDGFKPTQAQQKAALLSITKQEANDFIDSKFEAMRQKHLTSGSTQAMVYLLKAAEAKLYKIDPSGSCPFLQASVTAGEATDLAVAADYILTKETELIGLAAQLEASRLTAKRAVEAATTVEAIEAIISGVSS